MQHTYWTTGMNMEQKKTLQLLQACQEGTRMDCWEELHIQTLHQQKGLIIEQQVNDTDPLFEIAKITNTPRLKP